MNNTKHRSPFAIVGRLIVLVKPMLPIMLAAIVMGVAGHFCATFITIFGGFGILRALGLASPVGTVGAAFACILVFALLRGVLRYAEQASNHYIAFKLLALIRDKVFGALRRLTPAKLEGRDRGDLISLITADIEALEVFYAHTISPICIAILCVIGMTGFVASYHILPALVLLAGYLLVGVALPVWSAKRGDRVAREYRQALADTNSYVLESLRGLRDTLQYQDTASRAEGINAHSETLGEKQKALKYREGLTVAITNTLILFTVIAAGVHPVGSELLWPGGGAGKPRCQPDPGVRQRRPRAGPAGRRTRHRRRDRRHRHCLCRGRGTERQLCLRRRGSAA